MQLVIGNQNYSSWSLRPWVLLQHFNVKFEQQLISLFAEDMLIQMSPFCPNNKVPVLIDDKEKIWDSLAICEYINEQYLSGNAWPENVVDRAKARSVCAEMHSGFFALRNEMPMNCCRVPSSIKYSNECQIDIDRIIALWQECLAKSQGEYLFGDFTIADAFYLPVISRFNSYKIILPENVQSYVKTMLSLPSYQLWLAAAKAEDEIIECAEV